MKGTQASSLAKATAVIFTLAVLALAYVLLGFWPAFLFAFGYVGGLILWLAVPTNARFASIKTPYILTLAFFILHKWEERAYNFFPALSELTKVPTPQAGSPLAVALYAVAALWLCIPWFVRRANSFGYYLAWTFFAAMGIVELAHFIFPLFRVSGYGYFPGMASVVLLAPAAWWGLWRLSHPSIEDSQSSGAGDAAI